MTKIMLWLQCVFFKCFCALFHTAFSAVIIAEILADFEMISNESTNSKMLVFYFQFFRWCG